VNGETPEWRDTTDKWFSFPEIERPFREGLWLSLDTYPLPVPTQWCRPGITFACVFRDRGYFRLGSVQPQRLAAGRPKVTPIDDERVLDFRNAVWWTPGLEDAWREVDRLKHQLDEMLTAKKVKKDA